MDNLNEMGLVELNSSDQKNITGGLGFLATVAAGIVIGAAVEVISDWDSFKKGVKEGAK